MINYLIIISLLLIETTYAQPTLEWARSYNGPLNQGETAQSIKVDDSGYVYITGGIRGTGSNDQDYCTIKYRSNGDSVWVRIFTTIPGSGFDKARDLEVDNLGNVYVTGTSGTVKYDKFGNIVWQDLTPNTFEGRKILIDNSDNFYIAGTTVNKFTLKKYIISGILIWNKIFDDGGNGTVNDMSIDRFGSIILTGEMGYNNGNSYDFLTVKYNSSGDTLWTRRYNGAGNPPYDWANALDIDDSGYVYITGLSNTSNSTDYLTFKYNSIGQEMWSKRLAGGIAYDIEVDNSGNAFVTGVTGLSNFTTIKYDLNGNLTWLRTTSGTSFATNVSLTIDSASNVFVAHSKPRNSWDDLAIIKYLSNGVQDWIIQYPGNGNGFHYPSKIILDDNRNIFVAGTGYGIGLYDFLTLKYSQIIGIEPISNVIPKSFLLFQNFPNPFNSTTKILFNIPNSVHINITIYNLLGQTIETLSDQFLTAGTYKIDWNAELVSSGIYFCNLRVGNTQHIIKLTLIK